MKCPYCGAEFQAPPGKKLYVCPYCGTVVSEGKSMENVYIFKPTVDKTTAFRRVLNFRPVASPRDLDTATPTSAELHFLPLYLYHVVFYPFTDLETDVAALALSKPPFTLPKSFKFPARWRTPFKPSLERIGVFHTPDLEVDEAFEKIGDVLEEARLYASVFKSKVDIDRRFLGVAYYPFWVLEYRYKNSTYKSVVDAVEGFVLYMEYPIAARGRLTKLGLAAAITSAASLVGAGVAAFLGLSILLGALGGAAASGGAALRLLKITAARRGIYVAETRL